MSKAIVDFKYKDETHTIECLTTDKMEDLCKKLAEKLGKDVTTLDFLFMENPLKQELTYEELLKGQNEPPKKEGGAYSKLVGSVSKGLAV